MVQLLGELFEYVLAIDALTVELILELRHPILTNLMTSVTGLGSVAAGLAVVGLFYLAEWREEFLVTLIALSITGVVVAVLMTVVQRPFPTQPVCLTDGAGTPTTSFPSGHAAAVTAYAMVARNSDELPFRSVAALAAVVAVSRIYLGTHFLSDTVAGIAIGIASVMIAERVLACTDLDAVFRKLPQ
jgi:membrane-associated phospholipid phosphatase